MDRSFLSWLGEPGQEFGSSESSQFLFSWPCCYQPPRRDAGSQSYLRSRVLSSAEGFWVFRWMIIAVPALSWKSPFIWGPGGNARLDKLAEEGFDCFVLIHDLSVHREDRGCLCMRCRRHFILFCCLCYGLLWPYSRGWRERQLRVFFLWSLGQVFNRTHLRIDPHAQEGWGSWGDI